MATITVYPDDTISGPFQQIEPTSTEATLHEAVDAEDLLTYIDFLDPVFTSGNCYEVLEFDLSTLPAGAVITSVRLEYQHKRNRQGGIRVSTCAIDGSGGVVEGVQETTYYDTWNTVHTKVLVERFDLKDGSIWSEYDRVGCVLQHFSASPSDSGYHRVYMIRAVVEYDVSGAPVATATGPSGTVETMEAVTWTYSQADGRVQTHYRVKVTADAATDPDEVTPLIDSGKIQSTNGRSYNAGVPLAAGDYKAWIKVFSTSSSGSPTESAWDEVAFTIDVPVSPVTAPDSVDVEFLVTEARVAVDVVPVTPGTERTYAIERSSAGSEFEQIGTVVSSGTASFDDYPPLSKTLVYRARTLSDSGPPSSYVSSLAVVSTTDRWWLLDPDAPEINYVPDVVSVSRSEVRSSVVSRLKGRVAAATSGGLGNVFSVTIRTSSTAEREALETVLASGRSFRLIDVIGREWRVAISGDIGFDWVRAMPTESETGLRDFHEITVPLVEVI